MCSSDLYGEKAVKEIPIYSYSYRSITPNFKEIFTAFFSTRVDRFAEYLKKYANIDNIKHKTIIDAAKKYKIIE